VTARLLLMAAVSLCAVTLFSASPAHAAAGINQQVNFQARLLNAQGATVPDGNYNIEFKIYQDGTGCVTSGSSPCGGTLKWTEDWLNNNTQGVTVKNGYLSIYLGAVNTALASSVDFNQDSLWLSINIGNTNGTCATFSVCSGDGEMLPFKRFAATPYALNALNANKLGGLIAAQYVQLAQGLQADSSTSNASISINKTGTTADIVDIQRGGASVLKVTNLGAATFKNQTDSAIGFQIQNANAKELFTVDTNASQVELGKAGASGINGTLAFNNGTNSNTATITSGVTSSSYSLTLPTALPGSTQCIQSTNTGVLSFGSCGGGSSTLASSYSGGASQTDSTITLDSTRLGVIIQDAATPISGALFTVQKNAGGASFFSVTTSAVTLQDAAGYNAMIFDSTNSVLKVYENVASPTNYAQIYYASGEAVFAASSGTTRIGAGSGNITMSLTGNSDVLTFSKASSPSGTYSATDFKVTRNLTGTSFALQGAVFKVEDLSTFTGGSSSPDVVQINQNNSGATGNLINAQLAGSSKFSVSTAGTVSIASGQSYTGAGALTVQGGSTLALLSTGANAISVDSGTTGGVNIATSANAKAVAIGNNQSGSTVSIDGGTAAGSIAIGNTSTAHNIQVGTNATGDNDILIGGTNTGSTLALEAGTAAGAIAIGNGTTAHGIQIGAGGAAAGNVQTVVIGSASTSSASKVTLQGGNLTTTNNGSGAIIGSGFSTSDTNLVPLSLDSTTTYTETGSTCTTTANQGAMYYNATSNSIRACVGGANSTAGWEDVVTTAALGLQLFGVVPDSATNLGSVGDIAGAGMTGANGSGPCKVYMGSTTATVRWTSCTAYSGGRKVLIPAQATDFTVNKAAASWVHLCLNGTNNAVAQSAAGTEIAGLPTFSANNPVLCIADISVSATIVTGIYDTRTFTTSVHTFANVNSTTNAGLGNIVIPSGTSVAAAGASATANISGVLSAWGGASTGTPNAILTVGGPVWAKATAGTAGAVVIPSATAGRVATGASVAGPYGDLGLMRSTTWSATCTAATATTCQLSIFFDFFPR
jgi:hypothetical protein